VSITPEYGEEKNLESGLPGQHSEEVEDSEREDAEVFLDADANEAHAPGQVCGRCGKVIAAGQDARRRPDGSWIHEVCPVDFGELADGGQGSAPQ
jgi:hypothetical protein